MANKETNNNSFDTSGIDTVEIQFNTDEPLSTIPLEIKGCIANPRYREIKLDGDEMVLRHKVKINPNELKHPVSYEPMGDVRTYKDFEMVMNAITDTANINDYKVIRCDFALDSYTDDFYRKNKKLYRYLILALSIAHKTYQLNKYNYVAYDPFNFAQKSIKTGNNSFEIEYYDKADESRGRTQTRARLELRRKRIVSSDLQKEVSGRWRRYFSKAINALETTQTYCNDKLCQIYFKDKGIEFKSLGEFIRRYQENIFTRKQLISLIARILDIDYKTAETKANYYRGANNLEFISRKQIISAVSEIEKKLDDFFIDLTA